MEGTICRSSLLFQFGHYSCCVAGPDLWCLPLMVGDCPFSSQDFWGQISSRTTVLDDLLNVYLLPNAREKWVPGKENETYSGGFLCF